METKVSPVQGWEDWQTIKIPWREDINKERIKKIFREENFIKEEDMELIKRNMKESKEAGFVEEIKEEDKTKIRHIIPIGAVGKKEDKAYIIEEYGKKLEKDERKLREILDFTYLNSFMKEIKAELPDYKDLSFFISMGYKFYAKLDLTKAYYRLQVKEEDSWYMVVKLENKYYRFKKMPFGLCTAPSMYQNFIMRVLAKTNGTISYLDDILIGGKTKEECEKNLKECRNALKRYKVNINEKKSELEPKTEILYLGYKINGNRIINKEEKIERTKRDIEELEKKSKRRKNNEKEISKNIRKITIHSTKY